MRINENLELKCTYESDFEELLKIRIECMRESLSAIGRFDPQRARERLQNSFHPSETRFISLNNLNVGFFSFSETSDHIFIDHLYIIPSVQNQGIGKLILDYIKDRARELNVKIKLLALKESRSNEFYLKNGFILERIEEWDNSYIWQENKKCCE